MAKIDVYVKNLVTHKAVGITLQGNQMVQLRFDTGPRAMKKVCTDEEIWALAAEVMDAAANLSFQQSARARWNYAADGVGLVTLTLERTPAGLKCEATMAGATAPPAVSSSSISTIPVMSSTSMNVMSATNMQVMNSGTSMPVMTPQSMPSPPAAAAPAAPAPAAHSPDTRTPIQRSGGEPIINSYLRQVVEKKASDLHVRTDEPVHMRIHGTMTNLGGDRLTKEFVDKMQLEIINDDQRDKWQKTGDLDFAHAIKGLARFRMNFMQDRRGPGMVARVIPDKILTLEDLKCPPSLKQLCTLHRGLIVVTGPTGSGKSTTLAAMIDHMNASRDDHILTLEDPIEFVHNNKKCMITQREIHTHSKSFSTALRAALREDPDIVLVGEMRDLETMGLAIETAETGHVVFGTLHTNTAASTVDRIIDVFPTDRQEQIRAMLGSGIKGVVAQCLCKKVGGGRVAALEVMLGSFAVANLIREGKTFQLDSVIQMAKKDGMQSMNEALATLVEQKLITPEEGYSKSTKRGEFKDALAKRGIEFKPPSEDDKAAAGGGH